MIFNLKIVTIQIRIEALLLRESFSQTETCIGTVTTTSKELLETGTLIIFDTFFRSIKIPAISAIKELFKTFR